MTKLYPGHEADWDRHGRGDSNWLRLLPECIESAGPFAYVFDADPPEYIANLLRSLGVEILVERGAQLKVVSL